jgi:hypothetical protein
LVEKAFINMLKDNRYVPAFKTKKYIFVRETLRPKTVKLATEPTVLWSSKL